MSRPGYKTSFERALESFRKGDGAAAAALCREVLARRPDDVDFLSLLGAALLAQRWKEQTFRLLDADYVTHSAEGRPKVVRLLRPVSRERLLTSTALVRAG